MFRFLSTLTPITFSETTFDRGLPLHDTLKYAIVKCYVFWWAVINMALVLVLLVAILFLLHQSSTALMSELNLCSRSLTDLKLTLNVESSAYTSRVLIHME